MLNRMSEMNIHCSAKTCQKIGEGGEEAGKVSGVCDKDRRHIHDPEEEPGIAIERPCQHYPKAQE